MITDFVHSLQLWPAEATSFLMLIISGFGCLLLFRFYGLIGLYCYIAIAVVAANIQVLTATKFMFFPEPIAHGTIVFTSLYLAVNILTEHYGPKAARYAVWISFFSLLIMVSLMLITLGGTILADQGYEGFREAHQAIGTLFIPAPSLFAASLIAYAISQYNDIWIFSFCRRITCNRFLWLRSNLASTISAFVDNTIFSLLAWWLLAENPLDFTTIFYTYILGTYFLRVFLSFLNTPFIYLSYRFKPRSEVYLSHV